jgi:hypothetical protein
VELGFAVGNGVVTPQASAALLALPGTIWIAIEAIDKAIEGCRACADGNQAEHLEEMKKQLKKALRQIDDLRNGNNGQDSGPGQLPFDPDNPFPNVSPVAP